jgi:hypothetical protein
VNSPRGASPATGQQRRRSTFAIPVPATTNSSRRLTRSTRFDLPPLLRQGRWPKTAPRCDSRSVTLARIAAAALRGTATSRKNFRLFHFFRAGGSKISVAKDADRAARGGILKRPFPAQSPRGRYCSKPKHPASAPGLPSTSCPKSPGSRQARSIPRRSLSLTACSPLASLGTDPGRDRGAANVVSRRSVP